MANETMDFLTALASRNGLAVGAPMPAVLPRIPSRFEPIAPDAGAWLMESSTEMEAARDERRVPQQQTPTSTGSAASPVTAPLNPSPAQTTRPTPPATHPALRVIERVVHERETQTIRLVERETPTQPATTPAMTTRDEAALPSPTPAPAQPVIPAAPPQPTQQTNTLMPKLPPAAITPSTPQIAPQPAATQPPDVHISIGRIEVRATSTAKKSEPRSKPATPNLERYLNSLSGSSGGDG